MIQFLLELSGIAVDEQIGVNDAVRISRMLRLTRDAYSFALQPAVLPSDRA